MFDRADEKNYLYFSNRIEMKNQKSSKRVPIDLRDCSMKALAKRAWAERESFNLKGIDYGKPHWLNASETAIAPHTYPYYYFLAGMVKVTGALKIVEVGTHQGGSARAMAKALESSEGGKIVTFDITPDGSQLFEGHKVIRAYTCDANSEEAFNHVIEHFGEPRIDLVFIDAVHEFWPTLMNVLIYAEICAARFLVLDDITLNPGMERLWELLRSRYGRKNVIDVTEIDENIRRPWISAPGFGVVRCTPGDNKWSKKWPGTDIPGLLRLKRGLACGASDGSRRRLSK